LRKVLIIIPCCGSKKSGGIIECNAKDSIFNFLTDGSKKHLLSLRRKLFNYFSLPLREDIAYSNKDSIYYMEAHKRYTGTYSQIYRKISLFSWEKLEKTQNLDLVIISALYGLLKYNEPIRDYNKTMKDKIQHQTLKVWWRNNNLCAILKDYIKKNKISELHNVLSNDYNEALLGCFNNIHIEYFYHDFSKYKSGSNAHRGEWINTFIQNFNSIE